MKSLSGLGLFLLSFIVLWNNEGSAVHMEKALEDGGKMVIPIVSDIISSKNDGKLVYLNGLVNTKDILTDDDFFTLAKTLKLKRDVEYYQWQQRKNRNSTATYKKIWSDQYIDSKTFDKSEDYRNPIPPYLSHEQVASTITLGAFTLTKVLIDKMHRYEPLDLKTVSVKQKTSSVLVNDIIGNVNQQQLITKLYIGSGTLEKPKIGDIKISFKVIKIQEMSVIAEQYKQTLQAFEHDNGKQVVLLATGIHSPKDMFSAALAKNTAMTWGFRVVGLAMMFFGLKLAFSRIVNISIPLISHLVTLGINLFAVAVTFILGPTVIAVSWIFYRPWVGGLLFIFSITSALFFWKKSS